jgi:AcrR family transcriptional regulator
LEALQNAPRQRPAGRSQRVAEAVSQATLDLIGEVGLESLTFESVAARAGVNRTTLYRRWGNKSRLLTWVLLEQMADLAPTPDTGSLENDVLEMMLNLGTALRSPAGTGFLHVALVAARSDAAVADAVRAYFDERLDLSRPIYERAIEREELSGSVDYELFVDLVFGPWFYRTIRTGRPVDRKSAAHIIEVSLASLRMRSD